MPVQVIKQDDGDTIIIVTGSASNAHVHQIFQRGLNCWANAPAEMKEVGDILTHGKILQDYKSQEFAEQKIKNGYTNVA